MLPPQTKSYLFLSLFVAVIHLVAAALFDPAVPCKNLEDCMGVDTGTWRLTSCERGFCLCENGMTTKNCSSTDIVRHSNRSTGSLTARSCRNDQGCKYFENSFCNTTNSRCDCSRNYILADNKKSCLAKADALDFPCVENRQCLALLSHTMCHNDQCRCIHGYHPVRNACYETIDIGRSCIRSEECEHVSGAVCTEVGICDCPADTVIAGDKKKCLPVARDILDSCEESVQCSKTFSDALCIERACRCRERYHFEHQMNRCFGDKDYGENCGNAYDCYQAGDENGTRKALTCTENVCICADNYLRENDRCVSGGSHFLPFLLPVYLGSVACVVLFGLY